MQIIYISYSASHQVIHVLQTQQRPLSYTVYYPEAGGKIEAKILWVTFLKRFGFVQLADIL